MAAQAASPVLTQQHLDVLISPVVVNFAKILYGCTRVHPTAEEQAAAAAAAVQQLRPQLLQQEPLLSFSEATPAAVLYGLLDVNDELLAASTQYLEWLDPMAILESKGTATLCKHAVLCIYWCGMWQRQVYSASPARPSATRMEGWLAATHAALKAMHRLTDAASDGAAGTEPAASGSETGQVSDRSKALGGTLMQLVAAANALAEAAVYLLEARVAPGSAAADAPDPLTGFFWVPAHLSGQLAATVEGLVRLAPKMTTVLELGAPLAAAANDPQRYGQCQQHCSPILLLQVAYHLCGELVTEHQVRIGSEAARLLGSARSLSVSAVKLARQAAQQRGLEASLRGSSPLPAALVSGVLDLSTLWLCQLLAAVRGQQEGGSNLTQRMRAGGWIPFVALPASEQLHDAADQWNRTTPEWARLIVQELANARLMDEAVWGGLGSLLQKQVAGLLTSGASETLGILLQIIGQTCLLDDCAHASLAICLARDGTLSCAVDWCLETCRGGGVSNFIATQGVVAANCIASVAMLLKATCVALDTAAGSDLVAAHSTLLADVMLLSVEHGSFSGRSPWCRRFLQRGTWREVQTALLPAMTALSAALAAQVVDGQRAGVLREVAAAAVGCCNPGCANMRGARDSELRLSVCSGCSEARFCSRFCQRQDWPRHKPICAAIKASKS